MEGEDVSGLTAKSGEIAELVNQESAATQQGGSAQLQRREWASTRRPCRSEPRLQEAHREAP